MAFSEVDGIYRSKCRSEVPLHPHIGFVQFMLDRHFLRRLKHDPSQNVLVDATSGAALTRKQFLDAIYRISGGLRAILGLKQGEVVMVITGNSIYVPVVLHAVLLAGSVVTTMNPVSTPREIKRQVEDSNPKIIVTLRSVLYKLQDFGSSFRVVILDDDQEQDHQGVGKITFISELLQANPEGLPEVRIRQGDTAALLYSSGTTGLSKGVVLSHGNLIASIVAIDALPNELTPEGDVHMVLLPMFHVAGFVISCCSSLRGAATYVFLQKYVFLDMLTAVQKLKVSRLTLAPPVILDLLKPEALKYDFTSLNAIGCGAAPIGRDTITAFLARYPSIQHFIQGYGMTETSCIACSGYSPVGCSGKLMANLEAKVVDLETFKPMPPNHQGELWLRGPNVMQGYLNNTKATLENIAPEGWLRTGDLVSFDENGYVHVVDRIKELIKYKGYQVAPAELETVLLNHPEISDCAVIPLKDEKAGEIPVAYVVRTPGSKLNAAEVMTFVANEVSPYKKIRMVFFVTSIPRTPSGKILRKELSRITNSKL